MRDAAEALAFMHARRIAHLDVKPDNILVLRGVYKLADWGRAAPIDGVGNVSFAGRGGAPSMISVEDGDARYLAPELLRGEFHAGGGVSSVRGSGGGGGRGGLDSQSPSMDMGAADIGMGDEALGGADFVGLDRADIFSLGGALHVESS